MQTYTYNSLIGTACRPYLPITVLWVKLLFFRDRWRKKETKWRQIVYSEWVRARACDNDEKDEVEKTAYKKSLSVPCRHKLFLSYTHTKRKSVLLSNGGGWLWERSEPALSKSRFYDSGHHVSFFIMLMNYLQLDFEWSEGGTPKADKYGIQRNGIFGCREHWTLRASTVQPGLGFLRLRHFRLNL